MSTSPTLVDTHCHLDWDYDEFTTHDLVQEAQENAIEFLVAISTEMATLPKVRGISESHLQVFHTAGVHPHDVSKMQDGDIETLRQAAAHPKCRAIGEIGLDYHYDYSPREVQVQRLQEQLQLALEVKLPVVIHSREAEEVLLPLLQDYAKKVPDENEKGVIHCFTGTQSFGQACLDAGFLISVSGILTFKNAEPLREAVASYPLERLLVETDSPFLAPVPHRGKKCRPAMVRHTAEKLAEIKGVSLEEVARITTENARHFFKCPPETQDI